MIKIVYPPHQFRIREDEDKKEYIFDEFRKNWLHLTPEEWVRQNFIQYLVQIMQYPASYIAIEKEIKLGRRKKRFDILVYNQAAVPWMMIECKKIERELNEAAIWQLLHYNIALPVKYLVLTNGIKSYAYVRSESDFEPISKFPKWE